MHCGQGSDEGPDRLAKCCHEYSVRSGSAIGEINVGMFYLSIYKSSKDSSSYQVNEVRNTEILIVQFTPVWKSETQQVVLE